MTGVPGRLFLGALTFPNLLQPLGCAGAFVGVAAVDQLLCSLAVHPELFALGLHVRRVRTANPGAFVPVQAEPLQRFEDPLLRTLSPAFPVGILNTDDELPTRVTGKDPVQQRGAEIADVWIAGRAWRVSDTDGP